MQEFHNQAAIASMVVSLPKHRDQKKGLARQKLVVQTKSQHSAETWKSDVVKCNAAALINEVMEAKGDPVETCQALKRHLPTVVGEEAGEQTLSSLSDAELTSMLFKTGDEALPHHKLYLEQLINVFKLVPETDKLYPTRQSEIKNLESLVGEITLMQAALVEASAREADQTATPSKPAKHGQGGTPSSLDKLQPTPVEKHFDRKLKAQDQKLDEIKRAAALMLSNDNQMLNNSEQMLKNDEMTMTALRKANEARVNDRMADLETKQNEKEQREDEDREQRRREERQRLADECRALEEGDRREEKLAQLIRIEGVNQRAHTKTVVYSDGNQTRQALDEGMATKEAELDHAYNDGQVAEAQAQQAKAKSMKARVAPGIAAKANELQMSANENAGQGVANLMPNRSSASASTSNPPVLSGPRTRSASALSEKKA